MKFTEGQTCHFLMGKDGELYLVDKVTADALAASSRRGSATIERVDEKTNTIYFTAPLPKGVGVHPFPVGIGCPSCGGRGINPACKDHHPPALCWKKDPQECYACALVAGHDGKCIMQPLWDKDGMKASR